MISVKNISLRRGDKLLLDSANATIFPGERVGIVGRNGVGKSSLFGLIAGRLHEEAGEWSIPSAWRMAEVSQDMPESNDSATDFVLEGDSRLMHARAELARAEATAMETDDWSHIGEAHHALNEAGEYQAKPRAQTLLLGLGFVAHELDKPVNEFSGGWRMRLQLARALMEEADLLLLDEPTNHLDLDALVWLENYLQKFEGTMLVISHDREFLDAITKTTFHIENAKLNRYGGNYSAFENIRAEKLALQMAQFDKQQKQIDHFQAFIQRFKAKASKAKQAQSRVKALERMEKIAPVVAEADFSFEFREPDKIPNPLLSLEDGVFGYSGEQGINRILGPMNQTLLSGQRIGLLGANGRGKSTWIKTIAGAQPLLSGALRQGKGLNIGYFAQQEMDMLRADEGPLQHMIELAKQSGKTLREVELRGFLGGFNFSGDMVHQKVGTMSGGEKARLALSMIVWQSPNLLLLDEPTNHLDLATREALSMAINGFDGTVILVSHDRALLRSVCDEFWLVADGAIAPFEGDMEDYQRYLLEQARTSKSSMNSAPSANSPTVKTPKAMSPATTSINHPALSSSEQKKIRTLISNLEVQIKALEAEQSALLATPPTALSTMTDAARKQQGQRQKTITQELINLEAQWFEAMAQLPH